MRYRSAERFVERLPKRSADIGREERFDITHGIAGRSSTLYFPSEGSEFGELGIMDTDIGIDCER